MNLETFQEFVRTPWAIFLVLVFFGASIFVHELGHFLAAKWRGLMIERFSIGFGPKLWGKRLNGVEYRISAFPLGGYVALPQLADMRGIEGESDYRADELPPISYTDKMIVSVAGAVFNIILAFILGTILWGIGDYTDYSRQTTTIGYVAESVVTENDETIVSSAAEAGLRPGDRIIAVDGTDIRDWFHLTYSIVAGTGRGADGRPTAEFQIERGGDVLNIALHPVLSGPDQLRRVGIAPKDLLIVEDVYSDSPAEAAGLQRGDEIIALDGTPIHSHTTYFERLRSDPESPLNLTIRRGENVFSVAMQPVLAQVDTEGREEPLLGIKWRVRTWFEHVNPLERMQHDLQTTFTVLKALVSPRSDVGLSALSGPVGIGYALYRSAMIDIRFVLSLTVLINVNLAILNLLPIPVLDGGHMAFATIARLRRRPLPLKLIAASQGLFMILLFSLIIYVSFFDVSRVRRSEMSERAYRDQQAQAIEPDFSKARIPESPTE